MYIDVCAIGWKKKGGCDASVYFFLRRKSMAEGVRSATDQGTQSDKASTRVGSE